MYITHHMIIIAKLYSLRSSSSYLTDFVYMVIVALSYAVCLTHHVKKHKESHEGKHATSLDDEVNKRSS